jgi:hypothetical protein
MGQKKLTVGSIFFETWRMSFGSVSAWTIHRTNLEGTNAMSADGGDQTFYFPLYEL